MKLEEVKEIKISDLREKSIDELNEIILDCKKQLLDLRIQKTAQKLENTAAIKALKTKVAQAKTVIAEKEGK